MQLCHFGIKNLLPSHIIKGCSQMNLTGHLQSLHKSTNIIWMPKILRINHWRSKRIRERSVIVPILFGCKSVGSVVKEYLYLNISTVSYPKLERIISPDPPPHTKCN